MTNFQLKYELLVVFDRIILCCLGCFIFTIFYYIFTIFIGCYYIFSVPKLFIVRLGQKVLKFEFEAKAIIILNLP